VVEAVAKDAVTISHGPIPTLRWQAMTMEFRPPASGIPASVKAGTRVRFSVRQASDGEFAIVSIAPAPASPSPALATPAIPGAKR
jgi:membrane fusion protein, copper/silver efflux system